MRKPGEVDSCCNAVVTTKFCPHCGRRFGNNHDLVTLLAYLRNNEATKVAEYNVRAASGEYRENQIQRAKDTVSKWKAWADQLEAAMKHQARDHT